MYIENSNMNISMFTKQLVTLDIQYFAEAGFGALENLPPAGDTQPPVIDNVPPVVQTAITLSDVQTFLESSEEGKQFLQSKNDSFFSKGLESWKTNNLDNIVQKEVAKLNPNETPEQKEIRELRGMIEAKDRAEKVKDLQKDALLYASEVGLPPSIVDRFVGDDKEATIANLNSLKEVFEPFIQAEVEKRFKASGTRHEGSSGSGGHTTFAQRLAQEKQEQKTTQAQPWV